MTEIDKKYRLMYRSMGFDVHQSDSGKTLPRDRIYWSGWLRDGDFATKREASDRQAELLRRHVNAGHARTTIEFNIANL